MTYYTHQTIVHQVWNATIEACMHREAFCWIELHCHCGRY